MEKMIRILLVILNAFATIAVVLFISLLLFATFYFQDYQGQILYQKINGVVILILLINMLIGFLFNFWIIARNGCRKNENSKINKICKLCGEIIIVFGVISTSIELIMNYLPVFTDPVSISFVLSISLASMFEGFLLVYCSWAK